MDAVIKQLVYIGLNKHEFNCTECKKMGLVYSRVPGQQCTETLAVLLLAHYH